jgi:hypothetical protein
MSRWNVAQVFLPASGFGLSQDLRYAWRMCRRAPGFTATAIFTLALGIGANTAVFSILDAVLLQPLPYREPDQLVSVLDREIRAGGRAIFFDLYSDYENWKKNSRSFQGLAAVTWAGGLGKIMKGRGPARTVTALPVTGDFFSTLGVPAVLGRTFEDADLAQRLRRRVVPQVLADPLLLASVSLGMILAALAAMYIPARRAATVNPLVTLRYE